MTGYITIQYIHTQVILQIMKSTEKDKKKTVQTLNIKTLKSL